jgi:hypothetical protein
MGEYWKPVNVTRKEYLHPHSLDCGLKWREWNYPGSPVLRRMDEVWPEQADDVRAVSDYGGEEQLRGERTDAAVAYDVTTEESEYVDRSR